MIDIPVELLATAYQAPVTVTASLDETDPSSADPIGWSVRYYLVGAPCQGPGRRGDLGGRSPIMGDQGGVEAAHGAGRAAVLVANMKDREDVERTLRPGSGSERCTPSRGSSSAA